MGELHAICTERYSNPYLRMLSTVQDGKNKENAGGQVREDQKEIDFWETGIVRLQVCW